MDSSRSDGSAQLEALLADAHAPLADAYADALADRRDDGDVAAPLDEWQSRTTGDADDACRAVGRRHAYMMLNRVLLHVILERRGSVDTPLPTDIAPAEFERAAKERFRRAAAETGHEMVFDAPGDVFDVVPATEASSKHLHRFAQRAGELSLDGIDGEAIGDVYLEFIPPAERRRLGQFYTPPRVAAALAEWAIDEADATVLDPCCGSGIITEACCDRLAAPAEQLAAVDVNRFSAQLTAFVLAARGIGDDGGPPVQHADFFDVSPADVQSGGVDATVANPPYVRQEQLPREKAHYRAHLRDLGRPGVDYADGDREIDGRADLYCYFLTHATRFLRDGGRLAWIIPTKWLQAEYGESIKRFLYDHYRVEGIVGLDGRVFDDAEVDTVLLFLERCADPDERAATTTTFARLPGEPEASEITAVVNDPPKLGGDEYLRIQQTGDRRVIAADQSHLARDPAENLHHYLDSPAVYTTVRESDATRPLGEVWDVAYGKKTGANEIFLLDEADRAEWGIEGDVLNPALKSVRDVDGLVHQREDARHWLLNPRAVVDANRPTEATWLGALREAGHASAADYLESMAEHPARQNASLAENQPWFDIGAGETAPVAIPLAMDTRRPVIEVDERVVPVNRFALLWPGDDRREVVLAMLNSNLAKVALESHGRVTGGGAVNFAVSDIRTLPVPTPATLDESQRDRLAGLWERLRSGDEDARRAVDRVLVEALGVDVSPDDLARMAERLKRARRGDDVPDTDAELDVTFDDGSGQQTLDAFD